MDEFAEAREWEYCAITVDGLLNKGPCWVKRVSLTAGTGGAATTVVYNGHGTGGKAMIALSAVTSTQVIENFDIPIYFNNGLYIDVGSNVTLFTIEFKEERS